MSGPLSTSTTHVPQFKVTDDTPSVVPLAGTLTGNVDGTIADIANIDINGSSSADPTEAEIEAAVNGAIVSINLQLKELQTKVNELINDLASMSLISNS